MEPIICDSVGDFPPEKYGLLAYCLDCKRSADIERQSIDPETKIDALRAYLRCSECGSREIHFSIVWHGGIGSGLSQWGVINDTCS